MDLLDIPDHHVPQLTHLNVECKLLEKDRGVLKKVLYGEAPPRGPTPFIDHFFRKGTPFVYLLLEKGTPFIYLLKKTVFLFLLSLVRLMNKSLKQEVFLSFFVIN